MLWLLLLLAVLAAIVIAIIRSQSQPSARLDETPVAPLPPRAPVAFMPAPAIASAPPAASALANNMLQPFSPIPLTVVGASPQDIAALRAMLEDEEVYGRERRERILPWLLTTNARVQEIDDFIAEWGGKFAAAVTQLCETDPEWASAGELDREDIRDGATLKAAEGLQVRVSELHYEIIAEGPSLAATADDALLDRYGFESLSYYFRNAEDLDRVHVVPSDDWYRPRFEALVAKGLARRGADVPPEAVLQTMTLKDMEAVAAGLEHKRFTRRAPAVEFLSALPDLRERLGRHVSLRELFQLQPLPAEFAHLELDGLAHAWAFAAEYALLLEVTYATAAQAERAVAGAVHDEYAKGWQVESAFGDTPCCPSCAKQVGERRGAGAAPRLPHHVGCSCQLSQLYG